MYIFGCHCMYCRVISAARFLGSLKYNGINVGHVCAYWSTSATHSLDDIKKAAS